MAIAITGGGGGSTTTVGLLAARPTAATAGAGASYFASDDNGGTLYFSDGTDWRIVGPGFELDFAEITAAPGDSSHRNNTTTFVAVTGLSLNIPAIAQPFKLRVGAMVFNATAGNSTYLEFYDGSARVAGAVWRTVSSTANGVVAMVGEVRMPANASAATYTLRLASSTTTFSEILLGSGQRAWIEAITR